MIAEIAATPKRKLARVAGVSDHTIDKAVRGEVSDQMLRNICQLIALLRPHLHRRGGRRHDPADEQELFQL